MIWFVVSFFFFLSLTPAFSLQADYFVKKERGDEAKFMRINLPTFTF